MESININLIPGGILPLVHVSQNDVGRQFKLNLLDGSVSHVLDGTEDLTIEIGKPDNHIVTAEVTNTGDSYVVIETTDQMTACPGMCMCELRIAKDGTDIGMANFQMAVERSAIMGGIDSGTVINDLDHIIADKVKDDVASYLLSATASVDNTTGTPSVTVTKTTDDDSVNFDFAFHNMKGAKGDTGANGAPGADGKDGKDGADGAPGADGRDGADGDSIGTISATVDSNIGTPSVTVTQSGGSGSPINVSMAFHNLKGEPGTLPSYSSSDEGKVIRCNGSSIAWDFNGQVYNLGNYTSTPMSASTYQSIVADIINGKKKPLFRMGYSYSATASYDSGTGIQVLFADDVLADNGRMRVATVNPPNAVVDALKVTTSEFKIPSYWTESMQPGNQLRWAYMANDDGDDNIDIGWDSIREMPQAVSTDVGKVMIGGSDGHGGYEWKHEKLLADNAFLQAAPGLMSRNTTSGEISLQVSDDPVFTVLPIKHKILTCNVSNTNITTLTDGMEYSVGKVFATVEIFGNEVFCPIEKIKRVGYDLYYIINGSPKQVWDGTNEEWIGAYANRWVIDEIPATATGLYWFCAACLNPMNTRVKIDNDDYIVATLAITAFNTRIPVNLTLEEFESAWTSGKKIYLRVLIGNYFEHLVAPNNESRDYTETNYDRDFIHYRVYSADLGGDISADLYYDTDYNQVVAYAELVNELPDRSQASEGDVATIDSNGGISWMPPSGGLPPVTVADEGKVLTVDANGEWNKANPASSGAMTFTGSGAPGSSIAAKVGDFYIDTTTGKEYVCTSYVNPAYITKLDGLDITLKTTGTYPEDGMSDYVFEVSSNQKFAMVGYGSRQARKITISGNVIVVYSWDYGTSTTILIDGSGAQKENLPIPVDNNYLGNPVHFVFDNNINFDNPELVKWFVENSSNIVGVGSSWVEVVAKSDKIPNAPTTNGTYKLRCVVTNGVASYSWVSDT